MRGFYHKIWLRLYGQWVLHYIQKERSFEYAGIRVQVPPGVFHPGLFFTTTLFIDFLQRVDFQEKNVLDIGTGSGLLALFAAKQGARTTALDINPLAVATCRKNAISNGLPLQVVESDLFDQVPAGTTYDYLIVNPPYFKASPKDHAARAFFAGENLEYFDKLFQQIPPFTHTNTKIWMILSSECDLKMIHQKAATNGLEHKVLFEKTKWGKQMLIVEYLSCSGTG